MDFPDGALESFQETIEENRRLLRRSKRKSPVQTESVSAEEEDEDEERGPIINGWELTDVNKDGLTIELSFARPIGVSSSDKPDLLLV